MKHIRINDKLRLEKVDVSLAPFIFEAIDRDRIFLRKWLPFVDFSQSVANTEAFIKSIEYSKRDLIYTIWYKEEFAGLIGYKEIDEANCRAEIGYWLCEKMQGKGIAISSVEKLINHGFKKLKLHCIQIKVAVGNTRSEAIPKKLNFVFEGIERAGEKHRDRFLDLSVYSLLKTDL